MIKQCVVRTGVIEHSYYLEHTIDKLKEKLDDGYTVVMCNKITFKDREWLEYILQKEE